MVLLQSLQLVENQADFHFIHQFALQRFTLLKLDGNKESYPNLLPTVLLLKSIFLLRIYLQKPVVHLKTMQRKNSRCIADWSYTQQICFHSESSQGFAHPHKGAILLEYFLLHRSKAVRAEILQSSDWPLIRFNLSLAFSFELIRTCHSCKQKDYLPSAIWRSFALVWSQFCNQAWASKLKFPFFFLVIFMLMYFLVTLQECFVKIT